MIYFEKHKTMIIGVSLLTIFVIVFAYIIISIAYPDYNHDLYGTRLINIKSYPLDINKINTTKEQLISTGKVNKVSYKLQGKLINFIIEVKKEVDKEASKSYGLTITNTFSTLEKEYYDIQVFITNEEVTDGFPIIGYKHHTSLELVYSDNSI